MKIGWKHVLAWLVATAVIAFCYVALGGFAVEAGSQILGITIPTGWGVAVVIALALFSAFQAAILIAVLSIFVLVFKQFQRAGMFD